MTLANDREKMLQAAAGWDRIADELRRAQGSVSPHQAGGQEFGFLAEAAGIPAQHDRFIEQMTTALHRGAAQADDIAQALRDTAQDFGATDLEVADTFHRTDGTPR